MSLDGFIAGPGGEYDWIVPDPTFDFRAFYTEFDTALMGRRTFELAQRGPGARISGMQTVVCTRTLRAGDHPDLIVTSDAAKTVAALKTSRGKDIWLFGGATLFRSLLDAGLVDIVEVSVTPILLRQGIPLLPAGRRSPPLKLTSSKTSPGGILRLTYALNYR
jgi:dihydrofolate reductase